MVKGLASGYQSLGEAIYNKASAKRGPRIGQIDLELIDTVGLDVAAYIKQKRQPRRIGVSV